MQDYVSGSKVHPTIQDKPELKDLTRSLNNMASEWKRLGIQLDISDGMLDTIEANHPQNAQNCLSEMLKTWLKQKGDPRWVNIVDAVESLENQQLGKKLREMLK